MDAIFFSGTRNASSWALRAWLALRAINFEFTEVIVDIRYPQRLINLATLAGISPSASVPALQIGAHVIFDSLAIMEFANEISGGALLPGDPMKRAQARALVAWQHAGLSGLFKWISFESAFYPCRRALTETECREAAHFLRVIDSVVAISGGPFLYGAESLADYAFSPNAIRLVRHNVDAHAYPAAQAWLEAIVSHHDVKAWVEEADLLPHVWDASYLAPGAEYRVMNSNADVAILAHSPLGVSPV